MNRTILLILVFLLFLFIWIFGGRYLSNKYCAGDSNTSTSAAPVGTGGTYCGPWEVSTNDDSFKQSSTRYLRFARNEATIVPYADDVSDLLSETAEHLVATPESTLTIVGIHSDDESNPTDYDDLGIARAEAVKSLLESLDEIPEGSINVESDFVDGEGFMADTLCHGAEFRFDGDVSDAGGSDEERIGTITERLSAEPVRLYFETDAKEPNLTDQNKRDLQDIVFYLERVPDSKVEVSGHTDNVGAGNERLSRKRAERTAEYLANNWNIDLERMDTKGYADTMPIADNSSSDGRSQNRRVEVRLLN